MSRRRKIQFLLWTYFWLLIFEGALRKWVFPELSTPLLVVRDPVALLAVLMGWGYLMRTPWRGWVFAFWAIGVVAVFFAMSFGHGDFITAAYGARILFLHFPLMFLFAAVNTRDDVWKYARVLALVAIPMAVLMVLQSSLPAGHILNVAPGGEKTAAFAGALGKFRPPGTFSFTNGATEFFALAAASVAALLLGGPRPLPKWIWVSLAALVVTLPVSISRSLLLKYSGVGLGAVLAAGLSGRQMKYLFLGLAAIPVLAYGALRIPAVQEAQVAFQVRWEMANEAEGGEEGLQGALAERVGGDTVGRLVGVFDVPVLGQGIGLGTNVGALRVAGKQRFIVAEDAWGAMLGELGSLLGLLLIGLRVALALVLFKRSLSHARRGNTLPLLLGSYALILVAIANPSQPTLLGFMVVGTGLMIAGFNPTMEELRRRQARAASSRGLTTAR